MAGYVLNQPRRVFARGMAMNRPLTITVIAMLLTLAAALIGLIVDPRVITGAPAWLKPAKFALSITIYAATLVWLLGFVRGHQRVVHLVTWVTTGGLLVEMALIVEQVIRGTTSHFNVSTPLNSAIWGIMGTTVVAIWTATLILGIALLRQRFADAAFAWALRFGVLVSLVGMGIAFFMTSPTDAQQTVARAGHGMPIAGAHSVGVADGGPGLPIVGWSTVGGDLRVPHFAGLHALQLLPLFGWLLARTAPRLTTAARAALVCIAGVVYLGIVGILTWQARRGQSVIAPDARTLAAFGILLIAAGGATLIVLLRTRRVPAIRPTPHHARHNEGAQAHGDASGR